MGLMALCIVLPGAVAGRALFSESSLPAVLSLVLCTGLEERLTTCPSSNDTQCGQFDDAGVICQGCKLLQ